MAAQGGALADFGRRPLGFKVGVFFGVAAAIGLVYYQLMLRPLQKKLKAAKSRHAALVTEQTDLKSQSDKDKAMAAERVQLQTQLDADRQALPTEAEVPAFFDTINRKVGDAGVQVKRWEYKKEVPVDDFYRVPVDIELSGTFLQLKHFFASLLPRDVGDAGATAQKDRVITIDDLTLSDPSVKDGELILTAKFTASTFRQEEPKQAAAPPGGAVLPLPPAGSGSGAPSGGLPGQVKSEVEHDMQMSKDRAGSAHPDGNAKLKGGM